MSGVNIPPSIFAGAAQPFTTASQQHPLSNSGEAWKLQGLQGLPSWQDRLTPAMDWQPDSTLPLSSLPLSEASFGLSSIQSRQSLGEKVSLGSKQMALSVLDILAAKPPGPSSPPRIDAAPATSEQPEAGRPSARSPQAASPLTGLDRELSIRNLPDPVHMQSPPQLVDMSGPLGDPPQALQQPMAEICSPSGRVLPPAQYPLFTQMPSPIPSSTFGMDEPRQQQQRSPPHESLHTHSLDPLLGRSARSTRGASSGGADGVTRRSMRAASGAVPAAAAQLPIKAEFNSGATPQTSGALLPHRTAGTSACHIPSSCAAGRPQKKRRQCSSLICSVWY